MRDIRQKPEGQEPKTHKRAGNIPKVIPHRKVGVILPEVI